MKEQKKKMKFCVAGIFFSTYWLLYLLFMIKAFPYTETLYNIQPFIFIAFGIALLFKNKIINTVIWAWMFLSSIVNMVIVYKAIVFSANITTITVLYQINPIIISLIQLVTLLILVLVSIKTGQNNFIWKPCKIFVVVAGIVTVLQRFVTISENCVTSNPQLTIAINMPILRKALLSSLWFATTFLFVLWAEKPYKQEKGSD